MRIWVFGLIALTIGASAGAIATRARFTIVEDRFEITGTLPKAGMGGMQPSEVALVGDDTKDFGLIRYESEHAHVFKIRNNGDSPLQVNKDTVSCGLCVLTTFESAAVSPGETLEIPVTLRARKKGPKLQENLELRTSDPAHRTVALNLVAYIGSAARLTAEGFPLGAVDSLEGTTASCQIHGHFSDEIEFIESQFTHEPKQEHFEFEIKQLDIDDLPEKDPYIRTAYELALRVKPGIPVGQFRQGLKLTARVAGHEDTTLSMPIEGRVAGAISLLGPQYAAQYGYLSGGRVSSDKGKTWQMKVIVKGPQHADVKLTIDSIVPKQCLTASLGEPEIGDKITMHPLTVSVPKGSPSVTRLGNDQGDAGQVIIKTTHPASKEVVLLVRFTVE